MGYKDVERGLAGRVTEVGTPAPKMKPVSKGQKASGTFADIGIGLLAAAPIVAMAVPGLQPLALAAIAGSSALGVGLGSRARQGAKATRAESLNTIAGQNANESSEPRN